MINYFIEIRNRIFLLFISYLLLFIVIYYYSYFLLILTIFLNKEIINNNILNYFIFTSISDLFFIYLKLAASFSNYLIYFVISYHLICFLKPGLYKKEFLSIKFYFQVNFIFNLTLLLLFNNTLLPFISQFFFNIYFDKNNYINLFFEANICEYFIFYKKTYLSFFINFQIMVLFLLCLNYFDLNSKMIKKIRKIIYLMILLFSTAITPPDVISLLLFYFILLSLFEINFFVTVLKKLIR